jgi:hypothetical protein
MKKGLMIGLALTLVMAFGIVAFAEVAEAPQWYNDMLKWRQERLQQAVEEGLVTEEQAEWQQERWEAMEAYRAEQGFDNWGFGPCHGGAGFDGRPGGFGGMMNGFRGRMGGGLRGSWNNPPVN